MGLTLDRDTGNIRSLKAEGVTFSYAFLTSARPKDNYKAGTYGAELVINDKETEKEITQYLKQVIEEAKDTLWKGKVPRDMKLPIRETNENNELENGAVVVLKTSSKNQPKLFIRNEESGRAHEVAEDEIEEIYSGMIGEAIVTFRAYDYNGIRGVTAYLNAVCKTDEGTPMRKTASYEDAFSLETEFDSQPAQKSKPKQKQTEEELEIEDGELDITSFIKPKPVAKSTSADSISSIDDLLAR